MSDLCMNVLSAKCGEYNICLLVCFVYLELHFFFTFLFLYIFKF